MVEIRFACIHDLDPRFIDGNLAFPFCGHWDCLGRRDCRADVVTQGLPAHTYQVAHLVRHHSVSQTRCHSTPD